MPVRRVQAQKVVLEVESFQCNVCGFESGLALSKPKECHSFRAEGGDSSVYPGDREGVEFVLCDDCLRQLVGSFKILPTHFGVYRHFRGHVLDWTLPESEGDLPAAKAERLVRAAYAQGYRTYREGSRNLDIYFGLPDPSACTEAWQAGFSDAANDAGDFGILKDIQRRYHAGTPVAFQPEPHKEDPPDTGLCLCGGTWPCEGD